MIELHQIHVLCAPGDQPAHLIEHKKAPAEADRGAQRDQCVHIRSTVDQGAEAAGEKPAVDGHDGQCDQHLGQRQRQVVMFKISRQRPSPHIMSHGDVHQHRQEAHRQNQAALQLRCLPVLQRLFLRGEGPGSAPVILLCGFLRRCAVARVLHSADDLFPAGRSLHAHGVGQEAHAACRYTGHFGNCFFHPGLAGRTAHPCYDVLFQCFFLFYLSRHLRIRFP